MESLANLVSILTQQSGDAWCVVRHTPFGVEWCSALLRQKLLLRDSSLLEPRVDEQTRIETAVREICSLIPVDFRSGDRIQLPEPIGPYTQVDLTKLNLAEGVDGTLLFLQESEQASDALEIADRIQSLSRRQKEILVGLYAGETNRSMSMRMDISEKTVEKHRARVMENMQAATAAQLIRMVTVAQLSSAGPGLNLNPVAG